jgi:hypothetical protein
VSWRTVWYKLWLKLLLFTFNVNVREKSKNIENSNLFKYNSSSSKICKNKYIINISESFFASSTLWCRVINNTTAVKFDSQLAIEYWLLCNFNGIYNVKLKWIVSYKFYIHFWSTVIGKFESFCTSASYSLLKLSLIFCRVFKRW